MSADHFVGWNVWKGENYETDEMSKSIQDFFKLWFIMEMAVVMITTLESNDYFYLLSHRIIMITFISSKDWRKCIEIYFVISEIHGYPRFC